jgi:hypothetical protein
MTRPTRYFIAVLLVCLFLFKAGSAQKEFYIKSGNKFQLTNQGASFLASLPLKCLEKEFPYKTGITFSDSTLVTEPKNYHPAFFGCYDWHSSVHGHWMLVKLLKDFPSIPEAEHIRQILSAHLTAENIEKELQIFRSDNLNFERTYGWAWFLYLQKELLSWNDPWAQGLSRNLKPLADYFSAAWKKFLTNLVYPIRVGEHTNLAFGLSLSWDYAVSANDTVLTRSIKEAALRFYGKDRSCPVSWEPGGSDFLSPCLEEAELMSRIMNGDAFTKWLKAFMPQLFTAPSTLFKLALVKDRTDGKLVHLDGLNFSRSWCLYEIAKHLPESNAKPIRTVAFQHLSAALPNIASGRYAGEHWLASFAVFSLSKF